MAIYNDYKRKKEKKPQLSQVGLNHYVQHLSDYLLQPWFCRSMYSELRDVTDKLVNGMRRYVIYLRESSERVSTAHVSTELARSSVENVMMKTIPGNSEPVYSDLSRAFTELPEYQPIVLNEHAPEDRFDRRKWLDDLQFSFTLMLYRYPHGNHLGTMNFGWKFSEFDQTLNQRTISQLNASQKLYFTRQVRKEFFDKYTHGLVFKSFTKK